MHPRRSFSTPDDQVPPPHGSVRLTGLLGNRLDSLRVNRLRVQEDDFFLWPFQEWWRSGFDRENPAPSQRPEITQGDWHGEFMGTVVATASVCARDAGDEQLAMKVANLVDKWLDTQAPDGYLGTYVEEDRWTSWDIWVQAHDILGLVVFHEMTGDSASLDAAVRVADRVLKDFGPEGMSMQGLGPSEGLASAAIVEPMVWLHRLTDEAKYLQFAKWLVDDDWEGPGGVRIVSSLLEGAGVADISTAKAAEMLIDLAGVVELYRATGEERYLNAALAAWEDIYANHLYVTGTASTGEHFRSDLQTPNDGLLRIGETCVAMTWMYLSAHLGRVTGESRFYDAVEQTLYNHILSAQSPDGRGWAYYVGLRDAKRYGWHTNPECCPTRGARALAMAPSLAFAIDNEGIVVNLFDDASATLPSPQGSTVDLQLSGDFPRSGDIELSVALSETERFRIRVRAPGWSPAIAVQLNGSELAVEVDADGYLSIDREWSDGDIIGLGFDLGPRVIVDKLGNRNHAAVVRGPVVYALDEAFLPDGFLLDDIMLEIPEDVASGIEESPSEDTPAVHLRVPHVVKEVSDAPAFWPGQRFNLIPKSPKNSRGKLLLVPFYEAGDRDPDAFSEKVRYNREAVLDLTFTVWIPYEYV